MSMTAAESACKAKYLAMTIDQLKRQCEDAWLATNGLKSDLVARLVDYEKPAGGWAAASASAAPPSSGRPASSSGSSRPTSSSRPSSSSSSSMSAAESACKAKYLAMTIDQLKRQCEDAWLATNGLKSDLVARLVDYEKPAGGWAAASASTPAPAPAARPTSTSSYGSGSTSRASPSASSSSMSAAESKVRSKYLTMTTDQLKRQCQDAWLSTMGTKQEMIDRLVGYEKPAGGWPSSAAAPAPAARPTSTSSYGSGSASRASPSASSSSMSAAESKVRSKYLTMTTDQLKRRCQDAWLSTMGTKQEMIDRLVDYEKPAGGWPSSAAAPAPAARPTSTSSYGSGSTSRASPSASSSSMSAAESKVRSKYLTMTTDQLKRQCQDAWLSTMGTKQEMIDRLVDYEKPAGGWPSSAAAPAPAARPTSTSSYGSGSASRASPSASSSSMSAAESKVRSKYLAMSGEQLKRQCQDAWLSTMGTKQEMIDRLVDYEKPAGGWPSSAAAPAPAARPTSTSSYGSGSASRASPSASSSSMSAAESKVRSKYLAMSGEQLKRQCQDAWLSTMGTKQEMIDRLVDYEKPAGGWPSSAAAPAPAPQSRPGVSFAPQARSLSPGRSPGQQLSDRIRQVIREQSRNLRQLFNRMDGSRTGRLSRVDFRRGLAEELRVNLSPTELDSVLATVDSDRDGRIQYEEFLRSFGPTGASSPGPVRGTPEDRVRARVTDAIRANREHARTAFRSFNRSGDNKIKQHEFEAGLRALRADAPVEVETRLFRSCCNSDNVITYEDFVEHFAPGADTLKEVRAILKTTTRNADAIFSRMDHNRDNHISKHEFKGAMDEMGLRLQDYQLDELMRIVDLDARGAINYRDFMQMFGPNSSANIAPARSAGQRNERLFNEVKQELISLFQRHNVNVEQAFEAFDRNRDGTISPLEFRDGLHALNINLSASRIQDVLSVIDKDGNGNIDYREFARQFGAQDSNRLLSELATIFRQHRVDLRTAFDAFDRNRDGFITPREFRDGLERLGCRLSTKQIEDTIRLLDTGRDGRIDYREFARKIASVSSAPTSSVAMSPRSRYQRDVPLHIRDELESVFRRHNVDLSAAFSAFDANGDGVISPSEMRKGLDALNINLSSRHVEELIRFMDADGDGRIDYKEFVSLFGNSRAPSVGSHYGSRGGQLSRKVISDLKEKFRRHNVNLDQAFSAFDDNGDGVIDRHEMRRGLNTLNLRLTEREVDDLIDHFDRDGRGRIEYSEFVRQFDWNTVSGVGHSLSRSIIDILHAKFRDHNVNVEQAFAAFDENNDGLISPHEFRQGLDALQIRVDWRQINEIINHFDTKGTGDIEYKSFAREFGPKLSPDSHSSRVYSSYGTSQDASLSRTSTTQVANVVISEVKELLARNRVNLDTAFSAFDRDGDGRITEHEFRSGLSALNIFLTAHQLDQLMRCMGDGRVINYRDFVRAMGRTHGGETNLDLLNRISERLQERLRTHRASLLDAWSAFDRNHDGAISRREFCSGLEQLRISVSELEVDEIFQVLDTDRTGRIKYRDFAAAFNTDGNKSTVTIKYITAEVRRAVAMARVNLKQAFAAFDRHDTGRLSRADFAAGIRQLNIRGISDADIKHLGDFMDSNRSGTIEYREFLRQFGAFPGASLQRIAKSLRSTLARHNASLMTAFKAFDRNRDGIITGHEFRSGLRELGSHLSPQQIDDIMLQIDIDGDGYIDYREFVDALGGTDGFVTNSKEGVFKEMHRVMRDHNADLITTFRAFDRNGDGLISRREFEDGLRALGVDLTPKLVADVMANVDTNHSGYIDYREFARQFEQARPIDTGKLSQENERLNARLRELEGKMFDQSSEEVIRKQEAKHFHALQTRWEQQRSQFEATIANLQHQLAMSSRPSEAGQKRKSQLGTRVAELQAQVNDLRTFYSKKVRALEDKVRETEVRATTAEKKLRDAREKWGSTKARMTARLTFLERKSLQAEGNPGEVERLRGELQEARAHADWYQQQMAFFQQQKQDTNRALAGQRQQQRTGSSPVAHFPVGNTPSTFVEQVHQLGQSRSAEEQIAALRHSAEMERMRNEHLLEMERLRSEMRVLASQSGNGRASGQQDAVARLEQHLLDLETRHNQRELTLTRLGAATHGPARPGSDEMLRAQLAKSEIARNEELLSMRRELDMLEREIEIAAS